MTALRPASDSGPGLELLGYRPPGRPAEIICPNDVATDWVTIALNPPPGVAPRAVRDPDGHLLLLVEQRAGASGLPV